MSFIKVWCEYDIGGSFGCNNEDVYEIDDNLTGIKIEELLINKFSDLAKETKCETNLLEEGLMGWDYISIEQLIK